MRQMFKNAGADLPAALVVFLVALPLCLGVAQASGVPLFSGVIAGVVGGIVVGLLSGSPLSVSGPAAGLTAIVATAITSLPSFNVFLVAVVLAGIIQVLLGYAKAGIIGDFVPNPVIKGMLAAIGLILILKEIPHLLGYDANFMGDEAFAQKNKANTFSEIANAVAHPTLLALIIGLAALAILMLWETKLFKTSRLIKLLPAPLFVVLFCTGLNLLMGATGAMPPLSGDHLVGLPVAKSAAEFASFFVWPDFSALLNTKMLMVALTIAIVASLESLLSIEAVDKLDSLNRITDSNRELRAQGVGNIVSGLLGGPELRAQGVGNIVSGLLGGLPVTSVIVRSSANVNSGAKSKLSAIMHGVFLLISALFIARFLNMIPMAALAAILMFTGYKLAKPSVFISFFKKGYDQFLPFAVTVVAILFTDLLKGIIVGILVGFFFLIKSNFHSSVFMVHDKGSYLFRLRKDVSFLNKSLIKNILNSIPNGAYIIIDATRADFIDKDVIEEINNFIAGTPNKRITVEVKRSFHKPMHLLFTPPPLAPQAKGEVQGKTFDFTPIASDH